MATQFCQKCNQSHPGRICDHDEKGECAETVAANGVEPDREAQKLMKRVEKKQTSQEAATEADTKRTLDDYGKRVGS